MGVIPTYDILWLPFQHLSSLMDIISSVTSFNNLSTDDKGSVQCRLLKSSTNQL